MDSWPVLGDRSFLQGPVQMQEGGDTLTLSQRPTLFLRLLTWGVLFLTAFGSLATGGMMLGDQAQQLVCDRGDGTFRLNGNPVAPLADVAGAELQKNWSRAEGHSYKVVLILKDGTRRDACFQSAQSDASVAEYQAMVDAVRKFLADPSQRRLDRTFIYRAGVMEIVLMVFRTLVMIAVAAVLIRLGRRHGYAFDRKAGRMSATIKGFLGRTRRNEAGFDQVAAVEDRQGGAIRGIALRFVDGSRVPIWLGRAGAVPGTLPAQLGEILGKPVEQRT